jgi:type IV secretory pathway component VirB8
VSNDRKLKKSKKREEKIKKRKMLEKAQATEGTSEAQKNSGRLQLIVFFAVAIIGAIFIIIANS